MTTPDPGPAEKLVELLESAPPEVRREITAWLLSQPRGGATPGLSLPWLAPPTGQLPRSRGDIAERLRELEPMPVSVDSQMVTIRLPAARHAALRAWCAEHGFSMAAVVRGLVERFLEEQAA
jgi:hypothetical protein